MTLLSPLAAAIAELAADAAVSAITTRVRPVEPGPGDATTGDPTHPWQPFVVVSQLDARYIGHMGVRETTLGIRAYAATYAAAEALWLACEAVFRDRGARVATSRLGIYHSQVTAGGTFDKDPDTGQPLVHGIVSYPTTISAVPA